MERERRTCADCGRELPKRAYRRLCACCRRGAEGKPQSYWDARAKRYREWMPLPVLAEVTHA